MTALRDGCFRLLAVMVHRYSRDPATRAASARQAMVAAINLYAIETSPGEAALGASEVLAHVAQVQRRDQRAASVVAKSGERA